MLKETDHELLLICDQIAEHNKPLEEWKKIESCDQFQTDHYCGGFESDEDAFWFSYYDDKGKEYYFKLTIDDAQNIAANKFGYIDLIEQ
jgi:hypothetical protein